MLLLTTLPLDIATMAQKQYWYILHVGMPRTGALLALRSLCIYLLAANNMNNENGKRRKVGVVGYGHLGEIFLKIFVNSF